MIFFFFFQAEDGIRDYKVTGVQTCALPICLAAIGALADLLHGSPLDPERARALMMLHGEVRRAAEVTQQFLELAQHPIGAAEPSDASIVLNGVLADREGTLKELGVKLVRSIPHDMPMVACPMAQLTEMLMKLLDFSLRRLRDSQPPRELRIGVTEGGPSLVISLWDSGAPLSVEAEQRLVTPLRFTQSAGGGAVGVALSRAPARSSGWSLRLQLAERFVFVTGDRARDETRRFLDECGQPSVMKPYDFTDLIAAIGKVAAKTD